MITTFKSQTADGIWKKAITSISKNGIEVSGRNGKIKELLHGHNIKGIRN